MLLIAGINVTNVSLGMSMISLKYY